MDAQGQFSEAVAALHRYSEDHRNPLTGPEFSRLLDTVLAASDALVEADNESVIVIKSPKSRPNFPK